jgi:hypothetical protein
MSGSITPAQEKAKRRVARVVAAVCICVGLYLAFNLFELKSDGIRTSGKVIDENIVLFATENGQGIKFRAAAQKHVGDQLTVLYLPEDPPFTAIAERGWLMDGIMAWSQLMLGAAVLYLNRGQEK